MKDNCGPGMTCAGICGGNCSGSWAPELKEAVHKSCPACGEQDDGFGHCEDCPGEPDFGWPEPACFVERDEHRSNVHYALGFTHGWVDCEAAKGIKDEPLAPARGLFNGFIAATIIWLIVALFVSTCPAQSPPIQAGAGAFNYGYVTDSARTFLEQGWDTKNAFQAERGYCIEPTDVVADTTPDHANVQWHIHHVTLPESVTLATPYAISFHCSPTAIASIHTHTPTTCVRKRLDVYAERVTTCALGGDDAYLCSVDETDRTTARHDWFMVVQCGRGQFIWYWPGKRG